MIRDDYILRQVRQLAEAIARIAGLQKEQQHAIVRAEIDRALEDALGLPPDMLDHLDAGSLAQLVRDPEVLRLATELLERRRSAGPH